MKNMQQGFTLIELMIVVGIIGLLVTFALPSYQAYTDRTKIAEIMLVADAAKKSVSEYYMTSGQMPANTTMANINTDTSQSSYLSAINFATTATSATITYTVTNLTAIGDIAFVGTTSGGGMRWSCSTAATTVADKYLPIICRG